MKVNFSNEVNGVKVGTLGIGKTFCDHRRSNPDEMALYMIVDRNNAYVNEKKLTNNNPYSLHTATLAINLATGQLKAYDPSTIIIPVDAEVKVPKF